MVFVSHATDDLDRISELVGPVRNLPIDVYIAAEAVGPNRSRAQIKRRLANSDLAVVGLTATAVDDAWVNQEIGYATAEEVPLVPVVDPGVEPPGYVDTDSIAINPDQPEKTVYELLSWLRDALEPIGELTTPSWYLSFSCTQQGCPATVLQPIERQQHELWKAYEHGNTLTAVCEECGTAYEFNPATLGFIGRATP